jgi:polyhydroxyalkanoate synthase
MTSSITPSNGASSFDRLFQAQQARFTGGISPVPMGLAYLDWLVHLSNTPGIQARLIQQAWRNAMQLALYAARSADSQAPPCVEPRPQDQRFTGAEWHSFPFNLLS